MILKSQFSQRRHVFNDEPTVRIQRKGKIRSISFHFVFLSNVRSMFRCRSRSSSSIVQQRSLSSVANVRLIETNIWFLSSKIFIFLFDWNSMKKWFEMKSKFNRVDLMLRRFPSHSGFPWHRFWRATLKKEKKRVKKRKDEWMRIFLDEEKK